MRTMLFSANAFNFYALHCSYFWNLIPFIISKMLCQQRSWSAQRFMCSLIRIYVDYMTFSTCVVVSEKNANTLVMIIQMSCLHWLQMSPIKLNNPDSRNACAKSWPITSILCGVLSFVRGIFDLLSVSEVGIIPVHVNGCHTDGFFIHLESARA